MHEIFKTWLETQGVASEAAHYLAWVGMAVSVAVFAYLCNFIAKRTLLVGLSYAIKRSRTKWDDSLMEHHVFTRLSHLAPVIVIHYSAHLFPPIQTFIQRLSLVYMILVGFLIANGFLSAAVDIYNTFDVSRHRPIKGYVQIARIIVSVLAIIVGLATLLGQQPWILLSGLGAMTAVLILVFKDSILGLMASIQLSAYDLVRIGDWIESSKHEVDGTVVDITLHTVKVQNADKTITTVPAYYLVTDTFRNWRSVSEGAGRRIARSINIDMTSIKFCSAEMLNRFGKIELTADYIRSGRAVPASPTERDSGDPAAMLNGAALSNIAVFRAYVTAYLRHHERINKDMTLLVRHLEPTPYGLPLEIYVFTTDKEFVAFETVQTELFDHILAALPLFDLRVCQTSGGDPRRTG
jgi:miniconductance mechanosensitive channel